MYIGTLEYRSAEDLGEVMRSGGGRYKYARF
jgi:hypothetical protein